MKNSSDPAHLGTPALLVDLDRMERNLDRVASYAESHTLGLRPHIKTHKSPVLARMQLERGAVGVTCATAREAEVMSEVCTDILVMYPPVGPERAMRLARVAERVRLTVSLDSEIAAREFSSALEEIGARARVLVEIDAGMRRVGVASANAAVALTQRIEGLPGLTFAGVSFYPGHVREPVQNHAPQLADLSRLLDGVREAFARAKLPIEVMSGGSTPTLFETHSIRGVTEMRPGTYIFNDRTTVDIGACTLDDCALTVVATVVSTAVPGQAVIDAGAKALGREPIPGTRAPGYASLLDRPDVVVKSMSEEHGILDLTTTAWRPRVGDRVRVVPNHVCIVVHLADIVYGLRGEEVVTSWPVAARGRGYSAPEPAAV
jgi:D-serine deaminase-like pyridoxal phosphate-dependent protein